MTEGLQKDKPGVGATTTGRRHHYRVECDVHVNYQVLQDGRKGSARLVNLGLAGARLDLPEMVDLPADVRLELQPIHDSEPDGLLVIEGRVVWTVADEEGGPYPSGVIFQAVDGACRKRLHAYIGAFFQ